MAAHSIAVLLLFSFVVVTFAKPPQRCEVQECPTYQLIEERDNFEIRRYNPSVWVFATPISNYSFTFASQIGHSQLFEYANGANDENKTLVLTAPAVTYVAKGNPPPPIKSDFTALFYVERANQTDPPKAGGLEVKKTKATYVAVRQFGGYALDEIVNKEEKALRASLNGTKWDGAIKKNKRSQDYAVAEYNPLLEISPDRLNEIWIPFALDN